MANQCSKLVDGKFFHKTRIFNLAEKYLFEKNFLVRINQYTITPPNFTVCAQRKVPAKRFKICHTILFTNTQSCFFHLSFRATLFFPLMNGLGLSAFCWNISLCTKHGIWRSDITTIFENRMFDIYSSNNLYFVYSPSAGLLS